MRLLVGLLTVWMLAGCGRGTIALAPPDIHYGEDVCARCSMVLEEPRFAAAHRETQRDEVRLFDDVGDMLAYERAHPELPAFRAWVHDFENGEWVDAAAAFYVCGSRVHTPMGHGVLAVSDGARAAQLVKKFGGRVRGRDDARATVALAP